MIGAILTQNTNWQNVEKAINNLKQNNSLSLSALKNIPLHTLSKLIRPSGYYNIKAHRLKNFIKFLCSDYAGNLCAMEKQEASILRSQLLSVSGIGPETADSILLYAFSIPIFVIDAYTKRIFSRHNILDCNSTYNEAQELFMKYLPHDVKLFNEYHALIVKLGKDYCRTKPSCSLCPLRYFKHSIT
jgi:endonuclease-3 related protein